MKTKLTLITLLILVGCNKYKTIYTKDYNTKTDCLCNYTYSQFGGSIWFQDSCNKYNIGDTIK